MENRTDDVVRLWCRTERTSAGQMSMTNRLEVREIRCSSSWAGTGLGSGDAEGAEGA